MGNNSQLYIFLLIAAISFINWTAGKLKEQREIRKINEARKKMRQDAPFATEAPAPTPLAEQRRDRLRKLREQQAQRTREQISVLTGQGPRGPRPTVQPPPAGASPGAARPVRRTPRPGLAQKPTPAPNRRPLRPGRTARQTSIAERPAPTSRLTPVALDPDHTVLGALDHRALPSEGGLATETTAEATTIRVARTDWKRAIVLSEILAPPVSMRKPEDL